MRHSWALTLGNLALHPLHEQHQLLGLVISLGLLAHLLDVLGSIGHAIGHGGRDLGMILKKGKAISSGKSCQPPFHTSL